MKQMEHYYQPEIECASREQIRALSALFIPFITSIKMSLTTAI